MCPTAVQTATVAITNGHSVNVAVSSETATDTVYIYSRFSYVFFLCMLVFARTVAYNLLITIYYLHVTYYSISSHIIIDG